jgi:anthranilate synthase/aminodeoxychorismate synthase-like glutamine amidotransferase
MRHDLASSQYDTVKESDIMPKVLVIDNYDSFTYNLVQYLGEMGADIDVRRNDTLTVADIKALAPEKILISPGPGTPDEAGVTLDVIRELGATVPIFGVCLGMQALGQAVGGKVIRADKLMHGKTSAITHTGKGVFKGLPSPLEATRYHSLIVERATLPDSVEITAESADGEIMGLKHKTWPLEGVQFHPESVLTEHGKQMIRNFLEG